MSNTYRKNLTGKKIQDKDMKNMRIDRTCSNHGSCPWCKGNRLFSSKRRNTIREEIY